MMTMFRTAFVALFAVMMMVTSFAPVAQGAEGDALTIGVVDFNVVLQKTSAAKSIKDQLEKKREAFTSTLASEQKDLQSAENELLKKRSTLSKEEFEKERQAFEKDIINVDSKLKDMRRQLDESMARAMGELRAESTKIIAEIAKEKELEMVLSQDAVVLAEKSMNITDLVVERMNKQVKNIKVK